MNDKEEPGELVPLAAHTRRLRPRRAEIRLSWENAERLMNDKDGTFRDLEFYSKQVPEMACETRPLSAEEERIVSEFNFLLAYIKALAVGSPLPEREGIDCSRPETIRKILEAFRCFAKEPGRSTCHYPSMDEDMKRAAETLAPNTATVSLLRPRS